MRAARAVSARTPTPEEQRLFGRALGVTYEPESTCISARNSQFLPNNWF